MKLVSFVPGHSFVGTREDDDDEGRDVVVVLWACEGLDEVLGGADAQGAGGRKLDAAYGRRRSCRLGRIGRRCCVGFFFSSAGFPVRDPVS